MSVAKLSVSHQNYLRAIWILGEWSAEPVTTSAVAQKVGLRLSTVSDALKKLTEQGLVAHSPYGAIELTEQGRALAVEMARRHRLIETFLVEMLGYRWDQVHEEAEHLEHAVSDFMVDRLDDLLGHPDRDPHGDPIPARDGSIASPDAVSLSTVADGARVRVERISDRDSELLRFFAEHGIGVGVPLAIYSGGPYSGSVQAVLDDGARSVALGQTATDAVWVSLAGAGS
ncbi:metal-dependent transcriptional regulator [Kocuria tytonicola]|uniref:Manganese transport regulator n=1 Tax=Kocuria tytonicola TaxID=2055946 RepID=A0A3L9L4T8_9MICC|nr:metal-dependent transcriptional regulator [Kocuria tytonicola]RLY94026.1 metal-dependent transcriptional regulator [Kocuria tytonicola]